MVALTPPLFVFDVEYYVTTQGKPLSIQRSPFFIEPAWTAVYSLTLSPFSPCFYDYAIVDYIIVS